jgi:hypothetical protein
MPALYKTSYTPKALDLVKDCFDDTCIGIIFKEGPYNRVLWINGKRAGQVQIPGSTQCCVAPLGNRCVEF